MAVHARRVAALAVLDADHARVEVGGQVLGEGGDPLVGVAVVIRSAWGTECTATSTALGSFGVRFTAPADALGQQISIEADGIIERLNVK